MEMQQLQEIVVRLQQELEASKRIHQETVTHWMQEFNKVRGAGGLNQPIDRGGRGGIKLDEMYFRRVDKFDGDVGKSRSWIF